MDNDYFGGTPGQKSDGRMVLVKDLGDYKEKKKISKKMLFTRIAVGIAVVIVAGAVIFAVKTLMHRHTYEDVKVLSQRELSQMTDASYIDYVSGVIRYGYNGAEYIDKDGKVVWNVTYEMENPIVKTEGNYAVIADRGGTTFTICGIKGALGENSVDKRIINADVSASGVACIGMDDETSDYVNFYDKSGNRLDIEIKTILAGDGYPMDMELSPNGQLLMMSYMYLNEGIMKNKVVFYNFSELGQKYSDRLVGVFNDFGEAIVPAVEILSDEYACAFAEDRVSFYSLQNPTRPALTDTCEYDEEIKSVFSSGNYVGIISRRDDGIAGDRLDIYTAAGKLVANTALPFEYEDVKLFDDFVILNNAMYCNIYTVDGSLKYSGELGSVIDYVRGMKNNRLMKFSGNQMFEIKLEN